MVKDVNVRNVVLEPAITLGLYMIHFHYFYHTSPRYASSLSHALHTRRGIIKLKAILLTLILFITYPKVPLFTVQTVANTLQQMWWV